jgi:hypothetical protein
MRVPKNVGLARFVSLAALAAALSMPWMGWPALTLAVVLALGAAYVSPRPREHAHNRGLRAVWQALQRRIVRHSWRPRPF